MRHSREMSEKDNGECVILSKPNFKVVSRKYLDLKSDMLRCVVSVYECVFLVCMHVYMYFCVAVCVYGSVSACLCL